MTQMQREIDVLRATEQTFRKKTLELELDNDDLERTERYVLDGVEWWFREPANILHKC
jgi:hypothetical protein